MCALPKVAVLLLALLPKPDAVAGWAWREQPRSYAAENLYEYINGSAALYLSYGFREAAVGDYVQGDPAWITVDVYDMGAPLHAFGIYTAERPPGVEAFPGGTQGYVSEGMIAFWQDRYYVKVMLIDGEEGESLRAFAEETGKGLPRSGGMPEELARLPAEGRVAQSERYVKEGALGHGFLVEAVSAEYELGEAKAVLHAADLGTPEKSAEVLAKLRDFEGKAGSNVESMEGAGEECFAARDSYYGEMVAAREGRFVLIAMSEEAGRAELAALVGAGVASVRSAAEEQRAKVTCCASTAR